MADIKKLLVKLRACKSNGRKDVRAIHQCNSEYCPFGVVLTNFAFLFFDIMFMSLSDIFILVLILSIRPESLYYLQIKLCLKRF